MEDPANPKGNDLMLTLRDGTWNQISAASSNTLSTLKDLGWEGIFGSVKMISESARIKGLQAAAAAVSLPTKPWLP
ncbi:MAG TPA: hypothetical protein DIW61_01115 [Candidatus Aminicenantes bacterium]|nr:hypothetical protein [Candidatus Aminicenantes bacterium]